MVGIADLTPKAEAKGGTRIAALNNFLNKVTCSNCGCTVAGGELRLVSSKSGNGKVSFLFKCFNEVDKKGFLGGPAGKGVCGNSAVIEVPEDWTK